MPRDLPVGNGKLLVAFGKDYNLRDIYFPHVGKENHTEGHRFRFGIFVEGSFSWVEDGQWKISKRYLKDTLVTDVELVNDSLDLKIICRDAVDFHEDIYLRNITVYNISDRKREVRIFFHHDFHIYGNSIGDTAFYDPETMTVIHYKGERYFLIGGCCRDSCGIKEYATGLKETGNREGTWKDAEDGHLSGNPIAQGAVDSTVSIHIDCDKGSTGEAYYWIAAGISKKSVLKKNRIVLEKGPQNLIARTKNYWRLWQGKEDIDLSFLAKPVEALYRRSLLILRTQIDDSGAIIAANDTDIIEFSRDTYSYMWPRDGALTAYALDLAGYPELTRRFFLFCGDIVETKGYFLHKYNPDKTVASSWHPWIKDGIVRLPIQEDETALVIWALWKHFEIYKDIEFIKPLYRRLIKGCADFMADFRDKTTGLPLPSYDLWEERYGIHTFTVATVFAGLNAAANFTEAFGETGIAAKYRLAAKQVRNGLYTYMFSKEKDRFIRMINVDNESIEKDYIVDSSLYALFAFGVYPASDPKVVKTMNAVKNRLWVKSIGGAARYEDDYYHQISKDTKKIPGNPWFVCTLWIAEYEIARAATLADLKKAMDIIKWVVPKALPSGVLAEQVNPYDGSPISVSPLTWSHAAFITAILHYKKRLAYLKDVVNLET